MFLYITITLIDVDVLPPLVCLSAHWLRETTEKWRKNNHGDGSTRAEQGLCGHGDGSARAEQGLCGHGDGSTRTEQGLCDHGDGSTRTEQGLSARGHVTSFLCINSFNLYSMPCPWRNWDSESLNKVPKQSHTARQNVGIQGFEISFSQVQGPRS